MLGGATHVHKVNFCKFTNETRNAFEAAGVESGQHYLCAVKGACAGGGYELALACDHIILADDGASSVALPEVPLLAVLPGTGGLTRVTDKRKVRRDLADVFCSVEEGVKGKRAVEWRLVDEVAPNSKFDETVAARAREFAAKAKRGERGRGRRADAAAARFRRRRFCALLRWSKRTSTGSQGVATIAIAGPQDDAPASIAELHAQGASDVDVAARARARRRDPASAPERARSRRASSSSRTAIRKRSSRMKNSWPTTPRPTGWRAKSSSIGSACSSAST